MAGPDDRAARERVKVERHFKRVESAKGALTEAEQRASEERDKTAQLRAQRIARDEVVAAQAAAEPVRPGQRTRKSPAKV